MVSSMVLPFFLSSFSMTCSFSSGVIAQVEYIRVPPGLRHCMALQRRLYWVRARFLGRDGDQFLRCLVLVKTCFSELHGASSRMRSKCSGNFLKSNSAGRDEISVFVVWWDSKRRFMRVRRGIEMSLAMRWPVGPISSEINSAFPPGAAHASRTVSPGSGSRARTGKSEDGFIG